MLRFDLEILGLAVRPERRLAAFPGTVVPLHTPRLVLVTRPLGKGYHVPIAAVWQRYAPPRDVGTISRSYLGNLSLGGGSLPPSLQVQVIPR